MAPPPAVASALAECSVSYEDLADMEKQFEETENEVLRHQVQLTAPLYAAREKLTSAIPNFWPLVLEQAPPEIDQYIQPSDSALLLSCLTSLSVSHLEVSPSNEKPKQGDPRSLRIAMTFAPNDHFEDATLHKDFHYRHADAGEWSGLVSEPMRIRWKSREKDLTGGLLDACCDVWEEGAAARKTRVPGEDKGKKGKTDKPVAPTAKQAQLKKMLKKTSLGGVSFFAWFGYIGRDVNAEESARALEEMVRKRAERKKNGVKAEEEKDGDGKEAKDTNMDDEDDDDDDGQAGLEIFLDGDDVAVAMSQDLWPNAIKYFTQAQELDALSDLDFESGDEDGEGEDPNPQNGNDDSDDSEDALEQEKPAKKKAKRS